MKRSLVLTLALMLTVLGLGVTGQLTKLGNYLASDVSCSDCVALGSETSGGYAASVSEAGPATTATALAADPANCSAGQYPLGVDASGAVQSCTAASSALTGSSSINFTAITGTCEDSSEFAVTSAADGDACAVGVPVALWGTGDEYSCYVSTAGNVKVRHCNTGIGADPGGATTIKVRVIQ